MFRLPIKPMLAKAAPVPEAGRYLAPFGQPGWLFEEKYNGYRLTGLASPGRRPSLWSRPGRDVTEEFPELHDALSQVTVDVVFDAEVCLMRNGVASFQALAGRGQMPKGAREDAMRLFVFDVLRIRSTDLLRMPLVERKSLMAEWLGDLPRPVVLGGPLDTDGKSLWARMERNGQEGVIAKPVNSLYRPGERGTWLKFKVKQRDVFTVVGYTAGEGANAPTFGALVLAKPGETDPWVYAGKAGTGFTYETSDEVLAAMRRLVTDEPPFTKRQMLLVRPHIGPRSVTWIRPELEATIEYGDLSDDGMPIWPSFKGLVTR